MTIHFQDRRGAASLRYRNRPEISILCVNKSPIRYGFRAGPRAIRYSVDIAKVPIVNFQSLVRENNLASNRILFEIHLRIVSFAPNLSLCNSVGPIRLENHRNLTYLFEGWTFVLNLLKTSVSSQSKGGTRLRFCISSWQQDVTLRDK